MKEKVLLLEGIHKKAEEAFLNAGLQTERAAGAPSPLQLIRRLQGFSILCSRSQTKITKEVLSETDLSAVGAFCIGVNQIDLKAACERGIPVFNAPYSNSRSVAELTIALVISLARRLFFFSQKMHKGEWAKTAKGAHEIRGKILGIVGYGHIGSQVSVLAEALGMQVVFYDIAEKLPLGNARALPSLKEVLERSDFLTLHVPQTKETEGMAGEKEFALMKRGSFLINTARGKVVQIPALKAALAEGRLQGAALDVFPKEPSGAGESFSNPLQGLDNVILTPHIGGGTEEAQESIAQEVSKSLLNFHFQGSSQGALNFPRLNPPPQAVGPHRGEPHLEGAHSKGRRIVNIHRNRPGVLSQINRLISKSGANIKTQYLSTNETVGCLIIDVEKEDAEDIRLAVSRLKFSLKTRIAPPFSQ